MRCALLLLFSTFLFTSSAQDATLLPELRRDLAAATDDTLRADALARICFNLIRSDPDSALVVGESALALAKKIANPRALGDAHNNLGWLAAEQGRFTRADSLLNIALSIFHKIGKPQYTSVTLSNLGWLAEKKGDSVGSLKRFQEALTLSEVAEDTASASILHYSIGIAYRRMKDYPKALEHLERSQRFERDLGRQGKEANCSVGLANTHRETGDTASAMREFATAAVLYHAVNDHQGAGIVEENLGDLLLEHDPARALPHFLLAKAHYDTLESFVDKAYVLLRIGTAQLRLKELAAAELSFNEGIRCSAGAGDPNLVMEYQRSLAELAKAKGDSEGVFAHFSRYVALKDSLQGADTQNELARLRTEFETERKEKDNELLRSQNSAQRERIRRNGLQLFGSLALGLLALIAALLSWRNYRQKRKHADVLEGLNARLASSNAEITEINALLEMKVLRSQMNPHFIYNCLNSAAQMTQAGKQVEALAYLQGFARLLRMVLDHSVSDTVTVEEEIGFLRQYLKLEAQRLDGLTYTVDADRTLLDDEVELPALIVQPFVENAIWHGLGDKGGDRSISVRFLRNGHGFTCTIEDNGVGRGRAATIRKQDPGHRSLGMQLTSERLRLLSRRLMEHGAIVVEDLEDGNGQPLGTRVTLTLG